MTVDLAQPWTVVSSPLLGAVLALLARSSEPLTGREVHRLCAAGSQEGVRRILLRLADHGLVHRVEKRGTSLFSLNRAHLAAPAVTTLTSMRGELMDRVRASVHDWMVKPVHLLMFGSAARGDGGLESDIDLVVVRPDAVDAVDPTWEAQVGSLRESIVAWTGNHASFIEHSEADFRALLASGAAFLAEWRRDAVHLAGVDVMDLAGTRS